jgi:enamine deaminase RidA (YjgF/YER057c/UK114 family)
MSDEQSDIKRYGVTRRWSDAVVFGQVVYFVEVPDDPQLSAEEQFHAVLEQVDIRLALVGSNRKRLLQVMIYLPDPADLLLFNQIWDQWVPNGHAPSRACVHTALAAPGYRVELVLTAAIDPAS